MTDLATSPPAHPPTVGLLADVYEAASLCNKCSACQAVCPTYVVNPVEWESARGRVSLIRDAIEGKIALRDIADGPLSTCLTCNNCMTACAPRVPTADIVSRARQELSDEQGLSFGRRVALRAVFPSPAMLRLVRGLSRAAQVTGLHWVARNGGFTRWLGTPGAIAAHVGPLPARSGYKRARALPPVAEALRGTVTWLMCCYQNAAAPEATEATVRVFKDNGFEVVIPSLACSGLPARNLGDRESEVEMAAANTARLTEARTDAYIGDVAACTDQFTRYGKLLSDTPEGPAGAAVSRSTFLASKFLAAAGMTAPLGALSWKVAIDEPCSLGLDHASRSAAATLLAEIPRLRLVELNEAAMCCGGPGVYFKQQPERSDAILHRKFENVIASGCEVLVTENISCLTQLREGARRYAPHVRVMHLFEVLSASRDVAERREQAGR